MFGLDILVLNTMLEYFYCLEDVRRKGSTLILQDTLVTSSFVGKLYLSKSQKEIVLKDEKGINP
jgi:hypothetical protein